MKTETPTHPVTEKIAELYEFLNENYKLKPMDVPMIFNLGLAIAETQKQELMKSSEKYIKNV